MISLSDSSVATTSFAFDRATQTTYLGETPNGITCFKGTASLDWAIGEVPNVSYVVALMTDSVLQHFSQRYQKHTVALNCFFFRKTLAAPFIIEIEPLKMSSKGYCVVKVSLKQSKDPRSSTVPSSIDQYDPTIYVEKVHGIFTMGNMDNEQGVTHFHDAPKAPTKDTMVPYKYVFMGEFLTSKLDMSTAPRQPDGSLATPKSAEILPGKPEVSHSMQFSDGRPIDFKSMPYWCDMFITPPALLGPNILGGPVWCPTMQLEVQFKRVPSGKEILGHYKAPHIINGRFDLDGEVFDSEGNLLALTRHQCLVVPWSRNSKTTPKARI
ncbi:thioesterase-like superfamily-domain-containing protein [Radiomyces spectabilis]|uniref:thioesterase-like superfamily-domain-containing protein n=1 Tax=Radiomyces spectabilis TaxID=64574 RepID=UPI002220063F|nr:thioesterase-like superfamily-domain-containing protein [Radiomyces spectabilis]KAI8388352.1 thioesterase-like superfamily-domain-containing protein [Radiomyces spectabilis]